MVLPPPHAKLASGRLARLYREGVEPSGSLQKVSDFSSSFSGFILAQGKLHICHVRTPHEQHVCGHIECRWRRRKFITLLAGGEPILLAAIMDISAHAI